MSTPGIDQQLDALRRQGQHLDYLIDLTLQGRTIMSSSQPPARPRRHHWREPLYRELRRWKQQDERVAARRAEENGLIVTQAEYAARPGQRSMPAWVDTAAAPPPSGPPTAAPGGLGCGGCGVRLSTRWRAVSKWPGPHCLCAACGDALAAVGDVLGSAWRDRLVCRAAGLLAGSGRTDFAASIGFREYAEIHRGGLGTDEPFTYLGADLQRLRSHARLNYPEQLADETKRAAYVAIKEAAQEQERAKQAQSPARGGMLTLRPVSRPGPRWGAR